ncbi:MAG TPA: hypothetical protein PLK12_17735, partial [Prolixibacteraceae bacterium]|nr:hypothetical protein [Prolixibacteraceae bacterium]
MKQLMVILLLTLFFVQCREGDEQVYPHRLQFFTEEYKPFNYTNSSELTGLAPELLREICLPLHLTPDILIAPWD